MISCLTLTEDRRELDAQHMVCSYLVRACRQVIYELALEENSDATVRHRAIQVLKVVHQDWLEARKAVARELEGATPQAAPISITDSDPRRRNASSLT